MLARPDAADRRPRLLDLFCGAGGASMGYHRAGFDVVGVDIKPQPHYPFEFHRASAFDFALGELGSFDAVHASPPCQAFTAYRRRPRHVYECEDAIGQTRDMLLHSRLQFVIENVRGAPLLYPFKLCGSSFGLGVQRHRYFEVNWPPGLQPPCAHRSQREFAQATNRTNKRCTVEVGVWRIPLDVQRRAMGIDWMDTCELSQAIPPAYTEWIGHRLLEAMRAAA